MKLLVLRYPSDIESKMSDPSAFICPWSTWESPALVFCEEALCAWIKTPANSWSSLAFGFVGLMIYLSERRMPDKELQGYGLMAVLIGLLSFFYHASLTRLGEIGDLSSMFLIGIFLCRENMQRMAWITQSQGRAFFWIANVISTGLLFWIKDLGAPLFFVQCMLALHLELVLRKRGRGAPTYRFFKMAFFVWLTAQTIWFLDLTRIICYPTVHWIQGHAIWHVLMALLTWLIYKHYTTLRKQPLSKTLNF
jgi:hypothetical protein